MFDVLNSYLFQHKNISIPGLGTIYMESLPASMDASTQNMLPPLYYFRFDKYFDAPDREFFSYLSSQQKIPDYEALRLYSEFSYVLREKINREEHVNWEGVGELKKNAEGSIVFESTLGNPFFLQPVPARKVVRSNAQHVLLVGDTERTNVEMNEWLQQEEAPRKKATWWIYALIIGAIAISIVIYHFSSHGWNIDSAGNQQQLKVEK